MRPALCLVDRCHAHRDDPAWLHLAPARTVPILAHVRVRPAEGEAAA